MLYLKEANFDDMNKEYEFITELAEDENGFTNPNHGCTYEEFKNSILPGYIDHSKGLRRDMSLEHSSSYGTITRLLVCFESGIN